MVYLSDGTTLTEMLTEMDDDLSICSFNCRSAKSSVKEIAQLCDTHHFVLLQETWLLPNEIDFLSSIHTDFYACGHSSVDISNNILIGRPYGGTGVLYHKSLAPFVQTIDAHDPRISAIVFHSASGPILIASIYMPTDYQDLDSLVDYQNLCGKLHSVVFDVSAVHCILAGDFQCHGGSRFFNYFTQLANDCNLITSDIVRLNDIFTYISDSGSCMSWIDHFLCSPSIDGLITDVSVLLDFVSSDHKPMSMTLKGLAAGDQHCTEPSSVNVLDHKIIFCWNNVNDNNLALYRAALDAVLRKVNLPECIFSCDDHKCTDHSQLIDKYYSDIMHAIQEAMHIAIPKRRCNFASDYVIPGWNDIVDEKHGAARAAFRDWVAYGKPKFGPSFIIMKKTRASFKLALRYCKQHEDQLRADAYASHLENKDPIAFWKEISRTNNAKATVHVNCIGSAHGDAEIVEMWHDHFDRVYHSNNDSVSCKLFYEMLSEYHHSNSFSVTVNEVLAAIEMQKTSKAPGLDGISMEAFIHGGDRLGVHLALLFNCFICHSYLPTAFMDSVTVPLVKNKHGDLTNVDNYRAIMISNAVTKLLENVILNIFEDLLPVNDVQFGFKHGHSTTLCTDTLRKTIDHYRSGGSHVFVCFVDFTKAFDYVNYWKLFKKLIDLKLPASIVSLLAFWYANQSVCIKWKNILSAKFKIANGTRQGSLLSPCLFNVYISDLVLDINQSGIGCNYGGKFVNILAYADDLVLLAPSWAGLQSLLHLLELRSVNLDMVINCKKTVCMMYRPTCTSKALKCDFPKFRLIHGEISFVQTFRYLGHLISDDATDNLDIEREIRNIFIRTNSLIRKFHMCSKRVKTSLFKSFCLCFYGIALWKSFNVTCLDRFKAAYHKCIKIFFGRRRRDSMSAILIELRLPSFDTVLYNHRHSLNMSRVNSVNTIVSHLKSISK